jgi:hypothetical protein
MGETVEEADSVDAPRREGVGGRDDVEVEAEAIGGGEGGRGIAASLGGGEGGSGGRAARAGSTFFGGFTPPLAAAASAFFFSSAFSLGVNTFLCVAETFLTSSPPPSTPASFLTGLKLGSAALSLTRSFLAAAGGGGGAVGGPGAGRFVGREGAGGAIGLAVVGADEAVVLESLEGGGGWAREDEAAELEEAVEEDRNGFDGRGG